MAGIEGAQGAIRTVTQVHSKAEGEVIVDSNAGKLLVRMLPGMPCPREGDAIFVSPVVGGGFVGVSLWSPRPLEEGAALPGGPFRYWNMVGPGVTVTPDPDNDAYLFTITGSGTGLFPLALRLDGGVNVPAVGIKGDIPVPAAMTLREWRIVGNSLASCVFNIRKTPYADYPENFALVHPSGEGPRMSNANKSADNALTGWTTAFALNDIVRVELVSITATLTRLTLQLVFS